tara:strand:- start:125 stop:322 length:198 start_codon:yes stop_codon:yes gene_type:complete
MIDLRKNTDKTFSDKELHDAHIKKVIHENTDPDIIHAKHIEKLHKNFEESQIQKALLQDITDGSK